MTLLTPALAGRTAEMRSSKLRDLIAVTTREPVLSLAGGLPPPESFPVAEIAAATARVLAADPAGALQYPATEGDPGLLAAISADLAGRLGLAAPTDRLLVTTGSQQALDLAGKVLLDPGDAAVVESPTYVGALRALIAYQPRLVEIPVDADGMDTGALAARLAAGLRPKLCYLVPNFSNPSGATLPADRRQALAALAERYGFLVVEDDPYGRLRFTGGDVPPVAVHSDDNVLYLGSYSKLVAPGLRVGYALAPAWLHRRLVVAKQATDLASGSLAQRIVAQLLAEPGWLDAHVDRLRALYRDRARALLAALAGTLPGRLSAPEPAGGMFVWASIAAPGVTALALAQAAMRRGAAVVPGSEFSLADAFPRQLRLSFSMLDPAGLQAAVARIGSAFDDLAAG